MRLLDPPTASGVPVVDTGFDPVGLLPQLAGVLGVPANSGTQALPNPSATSSNLEAARARLQKAQEAYDAFTPSPNIPLTAAYPTPSPSIPVPDYNRAGLVDAQKKALLLASIVSILGGDFGARNAGTFAQAATQGPQQAWDSQYGQQMTQRQLAQQEQDRRDANAIRAYGVAADVNKAQNSDLEKEDALRQKDLYGGVRDAQQVYSSAQAADTAERNQNITAVSRQNAELTRKINSRQFSDAQVQQFQNQIDQNNQGLYEKYGVGAVQQAHDIIGTVYGISQQVRDNAQARIDAIRAQGDVQSGLLEKRIKGEIKLEGVRAGNRVELQKLINSSQERRTASEVAERAMRDKADIALRAAKLQQDAAEFDKTFQRAVTDSDKREVRAHLTMLQSAADGEAKDNAELVNINTKVSNVYANMQAGQISEAVGTHQIKQLLQEYDEQLNILNTHKAQYDTVNKLLDKFRMKYDYKGAPGEGYIKAPEMPAMPPLPPVRPIAPSNAPFTFAPIPAGQVPVGQPAGTPASRAKTQAPKPAAKTKARPLTRQEMIDKLLSGA